MAVRWVVLLVCLGLSVSLGKEVVELGEDAKQKESNPGAGPTGAFNENAGPDDTWGMATGTRTLNMPGAPYGKPGYKESHEWETDINMWAPVVFNLDFFKAMYAADLDGKSEAQVKAYWVDTANGADVKYPDCKQASDQFSLNMYYRANPSLAASTEEGKCGLILKEYLSTGIYDGKSTYSSSAEKTYENAMSSEDLTAYQTSPQGKARATKMRRGDKSEWSLNRSEGNIGQVIDAVSYYTYTFWLKNMNTVETTGNILTYGDNSPKISIAGNHGRFLQVFSAQTNSNTWGCDTPDTDEFRIQDKQWTHIAVVVENKKLTTYINGKQAQQCENDAGELQIYKEKSLFVPANEDSADAKIKNLKYWAGSPLNAELVAVEHAAGPEV
jgi:hypothetical protein